MSFIPLKSILVLYVIEHITPQFAEVKENIKKVIKHSVNIMLYLYVWQVYSCQAFL